MEDEQPVGQAEIELVVKMAEHTWLAKRALRMQNNCFSPEPKARQLAEIGFVSQKRAQAEGSRKAEKHAVQMSIANLRKQREEMKLGDALAKILPPDFDISSLDQALSATGGAGNWDFQNPEPTVSGPQIRCLFVIPPDRPHKSKGLFRFWANWAGRLRAC